MNKFEMVDVALTDMLVEQEDFLINALKNCADNDIPAIEVSPSQGKFLSLLTKTSRSKRILEIGTLGGYSTLWFAKGAGFDSEIVTLELEEENAKIAQQNFDQSPYKSNITIMVNEAEQSLKELVLNQTRSFDLIFLDADKNNNPLYLEYALQLSKEGTIIIADNIIRDGEILNTTSEDERVIGIQKYLERLTEIENVDSVAVETIGIKGIDGFSMSVVNKM